MGGGLHAWGRIMMVNLFSIWRAADARCFNVHQQMALWNSTFVLAFQCDTLCLLCIYVICKLGIHEIQLFRCEN